MKKIWLLTTLFVAWLLLTGCSFNVNINDTSSTIDEDKPSINTEAGRLFACNEEVGEHYNISTFGGWWDSEQEGWASFILNGEITYEKDSETIVKNVQCVVDMVDSSVNIYDVEEPVIEETNEENILVISEENMNTDNVINLKIRDWVYDVVLEDNSATKALLEKLKEWNVIVNAHEYWGFEKVWDLGFSLPREDKQITTEAWDIVLYNWNQISLFYDSNSWSYTKLWKVQNITKSDLWDWDVTLTFSLLK